MNKYIVSVKYAQYYDLFIEAEDENEAIQKAELVDVNNEIVIDEMYQMIECRPDDD